MATNKRKEAAALFELIDKSTLKVPKHAGALRIPDWWSSKSNPPPAPVPPPSHVETPPKAAESLADHAVPEPIAEPPAPAQTRLFEPPPANASPSVSPSIRPPASPGASRSAASAFPTPITPPPQPPAAETPEEVAPLTAPPERSPSPRRTFAPQTMDQGNASRAQWMGQQKRRMARTPPWAVLAAVAAALIVACLIVLLVMSLRRRASTTSSSGSGTPVSASPQSGSDVAPLLPPRAPLAPAPDNTSPRPVAQERPPADQSPPAEPPSVHAPGTVQRSPELYYVVISSTPTASVAQKNAEFLVHHGIDVSIEIVTSGSSKTRWYKLISVRGFPSMVAAEPFRKEIVRIGHLTPDFKSHKKVWDDAFITRLTPIAAK